MAVRHGPSPPPSLPERAPLHRCHGAGQRPLPDRADAMGTGAPREVPAGLAGGQVVTMGYAERTDPAQGAKTGISTGVLWEVFPYEVLLGTTSDGHVPACLNQRSSA